MHVVIRFQKGFVYSVDADTYECESTDTNQNLIRSKLVINWEIKLN